MLLRKPVWLKKASNNFICSNFNGSCPLWRMECNCPSFNSKGFLIFPYMSSEFQFSDFCKQQKALNHLTKRQKGFALNVKTIVTPYTQVYAYLHGTSSS